MSFFRKQYSLRTIHRGFSILLVLCLASITIPALAEDEWDNVKRIVALGDIHGDYKQYMTVLKDAGIVDKRGNWHAGKTHFVQMGDVPDRGPDTLKTIQHLQKLTKQAKRKGGFVHPLIGNHEAMNIIGDLRYVHPKEYEAMAGKNAAKLQQRYLDKSIAFLNRQREEPLVVDEAFISDWKTKFPLGYVEHRQAWHPTGKIGGWARKNNAVIRINNLLFVHGGLNPHAPLRSIREINDQVRSELKRIPPAEGASITASDGPLWYRGLARHDENTELEPLNKMLAFYGVDHVVVGHTPTRGTIVPRLQGKVLLIDAGLAGYYGSRQALLEVQDSQLYTWHRGVKLELPQNEKDLMAYYKKTSSLDPPPSPIDALIQQLESKTKADLPASPAKDPLTEDGDSETREAPIQLKEAA